MGPNGVPEYDELQRGQQSPPSVEVMERTPPVLTREAGTREIPVPDPGERPGAIRVDAPHGPHSEEAGVAREPETTG